MPLSPEDPHLVTLGFDPATFERLDRLRARYFPAGRNLVPAHLSLFHQLPGEEGDEIAWRLADVARSHAPVGLVFPSLRKMGRGFAAAVEASGLRPIHAALSRSFSRWLSPQDRQPFHPHVTIMNKAEPAEAVLTFEQATAAWQPFSGTGERLLLWRYRGGPWELVETFELAGAGSTSTPEPTPARSEG